MNGEDDDEHEDEAARHTDVRLQGGLHRVNPAALGWPGHLRSERRIAAFEGGGRSKLGRYPWPRSSRSLVTRSKALRRSRTARTASRPIAKRSRARAEA